MPVALYDRSHVHSLPTQHYFLVAAQESICVLLDKIFGIKHSYLGVMFSKIAETVGARYFCW